LPLFFWEKLHLDKRLDINTTAEAICLKELIRAKDNLVTIEKFSEFAKTFSPLRLGPDGPAYVRSIVKLCKSGWFYGAKDRSTTNAIFNSDEAKKLMKKANGIVLRLSVNESYQFCYGECLAQDKQAQQKDQPQVFHSLVPRKNYEHMDFYEYFEKEIMKKDRVPIRVESENPFAKIISSGYKQLKVRAPKVGSEHSVLNRVEESKSTKKKK
jgi:hypothetical protein